MKKIIVLIICSIGFFSCTSEKKTERTPNIIYFLADDLGYGELGVYGQSIIKTPHIDALARNLLSIILELRFVLLLDICF